MNSKRMIGSIGAMSMLLPLAMMGSADPFDFPHLGGLRRGRIRRRIATAKVERTIENDNYFLEQARLKRERKAARKAGLSHINIHKGCINSGSKEGCET